MNLVILDLLSLLSLQGRWAGARRAASLSAFRDSIGEFKNATNGKSPPSEFLIDFKSSEVGTLKTTRAQSLSKMLR